MLRIRNAWAVILLALLPIALFAPMLAGTHLFSSIYVNFYHEYFFAAQKFLVYGLHQWPTWWPQFYSGYPIDLTLDGFLNPLFLIALKFFPVLPAYAWLTYGLFAANLLAMYACARTLGLGRTASVVAAVSYGFSGIIIRWTDVIVFTALFPLLPLSILAVLKIQRGSRAWRWIWTALLAYGWIGGFAELLVYDLVAVGGFAVYVTLTSGRYPAHLWKSRALRTAGSFLWEMCKKFLAPVLLSVLLVSPWLISVGSFIAFDSTRAGGVTVEQASSMPVTLSHVIRLFLPRLSVEYGDNIPYLHLGDDIDLFIGTLPLLLLFILPFIWRATKRPYRWFFLGLLAFALLMSFRSPLFLLMHDLPVIRWFRWHFKWSFLTVFSAAMLAGFALEDIRAFFAHHASKKILRALWIAFGGGVAALGAVTAFAARIQSALISYGLAHFMSATARVLPRSPEYYERNITAMAHGLVNGFSFWNGFTTASVLLFGIALGALTVGASAKLTERRAQTMWIGVTILGSVLVWWGFLTGPNATYLTTKPATVEFLHAQNAYRTVPVTAAKQATEIPYRIYVFFPDQILAELQDRYNVDLMNHDQRIRLNRELVSENINTWYDIDGVFNHEPLSERRAAELAELLAGPVADPTATTSSFRATIRNFSSEPTARVLGMLNVKYVISPMELGAPYTLAFTSRVLDDRVPVMIYENPFFLPRWHFASSAMWTDGKTTTSTLLRIPDFTQTVLLDETRPSDRELAARSNATDTLSLVEYTAGRLIVKTETSSARWLVFAENGAPSWHARIDGESAVIYRANGLGQATLVPPGTHTVEFFVSHFWERFRESFARLIRGSRESVASSSALSSE